MSQKRASLTLSVNAIVVLILAIVMLGLGMAFIRGMFTQTSDIFEQKVAEEPEPVNPSISNPITISRERIITHTNEVEIVKIGIFNPTNSSWTGATPSVTCTGLTPVIKANTKTIDTNEFVIFTTSIDSSGGADTYICEIKVTATTGDASSLAKDITIEIRTS